MSAAHELLSALLPQPHLRSAAIGIILTAAHWWQASMMAAG